MHGKLYDPEIKRYNSSQVSVCRRLIEIICDNENHLGSNPGFATTIIDLTRNCGTNWVLGQLSQLTDQNHIGPTLTECKDEPIQVQLYRTCGKAPASTQQKGRCCPTTGYG